MLGEVGENWLAVRFFKGACREQVRTVDRGPVSTILAAAARLSIEVDFVRLLSTANVEASLRDVFDDYCVYDATIDMPHCTPSWFCGGSSDACGPRM